MKKYWLLIFMAVAPLLAGTANAESATEISTRLSNGFNVYILKDARFPLVCTRLYVRTGSANEEPSQAGISHVLEHMVFKGTDHRPKGQVAKDVEALGGYLNAATSFDKTWYITDMPAAHWRTGMDVVKEMAFQATLDPAELDAEKQVVISELQGGEDNPARKLHEDMQTATLANTPYGHPIIGYEKTINDLTSKDLRDYVARWYQPQNMSLLVVGDIDPAEVLAHAEQLFGGMQNTTPLATAEMPDLAKAPGGEMVSVRRGPWNKVYLGLSFPAPALADLRSVQLDVLCQLLGGDGTALLYKKYKYEQQLVDSISVDNMSLARGGLLSITAQLDVDKVEVFLGSLLQDMAALKADMFTPEELQRAKNNIMDGMDRSGETLNGLAGWKSVVQFSLGGPTGERNARLALLGVDHKQLQQARDDWFVPSRMRLRVMAPEKAQLPDFAALIQKHWPPSVDNEAQHANLMRGERENVDLGNGRSVILIPDTNVPYMSLHLMWPGGNALLTQEQQGLAELVARSLTDGCNGMDAQAMERFFADRMASVGANAGLQTFGLSLTGPSRFNGELFTMLGNILNKPDFADSERLREVNNIKAAIKQRADQPLRYLFSKLGPYLFPAGHPYGFDSLGTPENLDRFTRNDILAFWQKQLAQPWVLAVVGSFDRDSVLRLASSLPQPSAVAINVGEPAWTSSPSLDLKMPGRTQAHLMRLYPTVTPEHPDAPALRLLTNMLSGQSGLLFTDLRDKEGLGYTVTAFERLSPRKGFLAFYIGTTADKLPQAQDGFSRVIVNLKENLLPAELLKNGAQNLWGDYLRDRQSLAARGREAAQDKVLGYPQDAGKLLLEKVNSLSPEQIRDVARKYLDDANVRTVIVQP